ncbi:MAG: endonuclease domain-containing protein [Candidatus Heimdallarchaeaceae archaeon]
MVFQKGHKPWNKGLKGFGKFNKGKRRSIETRRKLSDFRKGKKRPGNPESWKHSIKTKKLLSKIQKGIRKSPKTEFKEGMIPWNKGKKISKEKYPRYGFRTSRKNQVFPKEDTSIEVKIQTFLKQLNIDFFTHQYMKIEHGYQCDILIPSLNLVIECDGDYWHKYPIGREVDHIRTKELIEKGFKVLRLWEFEIKEMDINNFKRRLKNG